MSRSLLAVVLMLLALPRAAAQDFQFHAPEAADQAATAAVMRDLAERLLPVYQDQDVESYLANLSALQLAAGDYAAADDTRRTLRGRQPQNSRAPQPGRAAAIDLYARAKALEAGGAGFGVAYAKAFADLVPELDDREVAAAVVWLETPASTAGLDRAFDRLHGETSLNTDQVLELAWTWLTLQARESMGVVTPVLADSDMRRRYQRQDEVLPGAAAGTEIHIRCLRPRGAGRMPALLEFAQAPSLENAALATARGYAGVVASVSARRPGQESAVMPFENDSADAGRVIAWIARQRWSDGQVGMYGEGYGGFAAWAAAKHRPRALKAIATTNAMAPGIDFPAPGRVFRNAAYLWALSGAVPVDAARWRALDEQWYRSGRRYRDLDRLAGLRNPVFDRWLAHPSYDRYWQKLIPFRAQFAGIRIPVLSLADYGAEGEAGALYYFGQHLRYRPKADHTLVIGADLDDPAELRLQWFDHVFRHGALPSVLSGRVNTQMLDSGEWRHAPSMQGLSDHRLRFYLGSAGDASAHVLSPTQPASENSFEQQLDLARRDDARVGTAADAPDLRNGVAYVSAPLAQAQELAGRLSGRLDFTPDRMDVDLYLSAYALLPDGGYRRLSLPYEFRASYAGDQTSRRLLKAGERQRLAFSTDRLIGRRLEAGSRLLLVLGVIKRPDRQINYGSGGEVSDESVQDARRPLRIRWYADSYVDFPATKTAP